MPHSESQRPLLPQLIKRLAGDGVRVAEGELSLALLELKQIIRSYVVAIAIAAASIAVATVALVILAQTAVAAMAPYLGGAVYANLSVSSVLLIITIGMLFTAKYFLTKRHKPTGLIFRWLLSPVKK